MFTVVKRDAKIAASRHELELIEAPLREKRGAIVRFIVPQLKSPLPGIEARIDNAAYLQAFGDEAFVFRSSDGRVSDVVAVRDFPRRAQLGLRQKYYSAAVARSQVVSCEGRVERAYSQSRNSLPSKRPHFAVNEEVYQLRLALGSWLFATRSFLDSLAPLLYVLRGPGSKAFTSFHAYVKALKAETEIDHEMQRAVAGNKLGWFDRLRDLRDAEAHAGPTELHFYETAPGVMSAWVRGRWTLRDSMDLVNEGLAEFLGNLDAVFSDRLPEPSAQRRPGS